MQIRLWGVGKTHSSASSLLPLPSILTCRGGCAEADHIESHTCLACVSQQRQHMLPFPTLPTCREGCFQTEHVGGSRTPSTCLLIPMVFAAIGTLLTCEDGCVDIDYIQGHTRPANFSWWRQRLLPLPTYPIPHAEMAVVKLTTFNISHFQLEIWSTVVVEMVMQS